MTLKFRGTYTAIVTPFRSDGAIDEAALAKTVEHQIASRIDGLVPCGTTGEGATMSPDEQRRVVEVVVAAAAGRVPVIAGAGGSDTRGACGLASRAVEAGASAILTVTPPYNKPTPDGLVAHYKEVARAASGRPIVAYNVPGRTGLNMSADTTLRLAEIPGVAAVKEASGSVAQVEDILRRKPEGFAVLSGDDSLTLPLLALGIDGVISVVSNEVPRQFGDLVRAALAGDFARARVIHFQLAELMVLNFLESNPIPAKTAMAHLGLIPEAHFRLPLVPMTAPGRAKLIACVDALRASGALA